MPFPLVPLLAAAASAAGAGISTAVSAASTRRQMEFQERMRNTQYQAAVNDMRLAGLNPMLAYQQGGAASPAGASFEMGNPMEDVVSSAVDAVRSRREGQRLQQELQLMKLQGDNVKADSGLKRASAMRQLVDSQVAASGWAGRIMGPGIGSLFTRGTSMTIEGIARVLQRDLQRMEEAWQYGEDLRRRRSAERERRGSIWKQIGRLFSSGGREARRSNVPRGGSGGF